MPDAVADKMEVSDPKESDEESQNVLLQCAQWRFLLKLDDSIVSGDEKQAVRAQLLEAITKNNMSSFYESLCSDGVLTSDDSLVSAMKATNDKRLKECDESIADKEENFGQSEVLDAITAKAKHYYDVGDKENAIAVYKQAMAKSAAVGSKIDCTLAILRLGLLYNDTHLLKTKIEECHLLIDKGGDWERRNRLKVYEATYLMISRDFEKAADLLISSIATFTTTELYSFHTFIFYTIVTCIVTFDRPKLIEKVIDKPEILSVIDDIPHLTSFLNSLHKCQYAEFFKSLLGIQEAIARDTYLHSHKSFFLREIRVVVYAQFLASYKSVKVDTMAQSFGVSVEFIDKDISQFVASGRLSCKIDAVTGVIESVAPDAKNAQYQEVIKKGDLLLNKIQRLNRIISY